MSKETILVTGGTGFLGSRIVRKLLAQGYRVIVIIRETSEKNRLSDVSGHKNLIFSPTPTTSLHTIFEQYDIHHIVHTATCYGRRNESWLSIAEVNINLPLTLLILAEKHNVKSFINADTFFNEDIIFEGNEALYVKTKKIFLAISRENKYSKVKFINMRIEQMFGPYDDKKKFIPFIIQTLLSSPASLDLTLGEQKRDFVYVEDVADAFISALSHIETLSVFEEFGIGTGTSISIKDVVSEIVSHINTSVQLNFGAIPYRPHEIMDSYAITSNNSKIDWEAKVPLRLAILSTIKYYQYTTHEKN